jgi:hypothetical protein
VRPVAQLAELLASLGPQNDLKRLLERFSGPPRSVPRLAQKNLARHVGHPLVLSHDPPFPCARPVPVSWYYSLVAFVR